MLTAGGLVGIANFGGDEAGHPELASLLSVYGAGIYAVPPVVARKAFPDAAALGVAAWPPASPVPAVTGGAVAPRA